MPVPRRFDRRLPERDTTRVNDRIRVPEVRLIGEDGNQIGVLKTPDALKYAEERDLDLVEVAPDARPPVCRVLDYSKYKYEQAQKLKAARKHQQQITIREIKFRPKIAIADYETKKGHVERFLKGKDKVKVTIMFRGREQAHPERGTALLEKLAGELSEFAIVEQTPLQDGRNMTMMLGPSKAILAAEEEHEHVVDEEHDSAPKRPRRQQREAASHADDADFHVDPEPEEEAPDEVVEEEVGEERPATESAGTTESEGTTELGESTGSDPAPESGDSDVGVDSDAAADLDEAADSDEAADLDEAAAPEAEPAVVAPTRSRAKKATTKSDEAPTG